MTAFVMQNMAPLMFAALVVMLLLGYPVAFSLAANGIFFGLVGIHLGMLDASLFQALPQRIWGVMSNDTLLAVPFFTFMGLLLERSGMAEDLLDTIGQLFGTIRGGLAYAVIPLVDSLTLKWFVRDLDMRAEVIGRTVEDSVEGAYKEVG